MARIVSVWLQRWPIARFLRHPPAGAAVERNRLLALYAPASGGPVLTAVNAAAEEVGLAIGDRLADARSRESLLQCFPADFAADRAALRKLALWATRYTPTTALWADGEAPDGFFLEIAGSAHLFGGEDALAQDLAQRLRGFGLEPCIAVADTAGAAYAMSRYGKKALAVIRPKQQRDAIAPLPVAALRLPADDCATLFRLGFKRVGDLVGKPRAPLTARFGALLPLRLDQALGHVSEAIAPQAPPVRYHAGLRFAEPILLQDHLLVATTALLDRLVPDLERDAVGLRKLRLRFFRVDGGVQSLTMGLASVGRDPKHITGLVRLRLEKLAESLDAGFGFDAAHLDALSVERMDTVQPMLATRAAVFTDGEQRARLVDVLSQRLGASSVNHLAPRASHVPERAALPLPALHGAPPAWAKPPQRGPRPSFLLRRAEPAEVMAVVPDAPPVQFRWRGMLHRVAQAEGPERLGAEWWRLGEEHRTRDYYVVEDDAGRRFWLYRDGLYERENLQPQWFVHGLFA